MVLPPPPRPLHPSREYKFHGFTETGCWLMYALGSTFILVCALVSAQSCWVAETNVSAFPLVEQSPPTVFYQRGF